MAAEHHAKFLFKEFHWPNVEVGRKDNRQLDTDGIDKKPVLGRAYGTLVPFQRHFRTLDEVVRFVESTPPPAQAIDHIEHSLREAVTHCTGTL